MIPLHIGLAACAFIAAILSFLTWPTTPTQPTTQQPRPNPYEAVELDGRYTVRRADCSWVAPYDYPTCAAAQKMADDMWASVQVDPAEERLQAQRAAWAWKPCGGGK